MLPIPRTGTRRTSVHGLRERTRAHACRIMLDGLFLCLKQRSPEPWTCPFLSTSVPPLRLAGRERLASAQPSVRPLRSLVGQGQGFPWVLLAGSRFPRAAVRTVCVISTENLPGSRGHVESNVLPGYASLQLSVQNTAVRWAPGQAYISLWNTLSHRPWQNILGGGYLGSKSEKCCFPLLSVERWDL